MKKVVVALSQGSVNFSEKSQIVNILSFVGHKLCYNYLILLL